MRISLRVIWTKTQAQAEYVIFTGFYFIIIIQHSATCGRYILLWRDIMAQLRNSLPVLTSWSHTVIEIAFVKFIWHIIKEIKYKVIICNIHCSHLETQKCLSEKFTYILKNHILVRCYVCSSAITLFILWRYSPNQVLTAPFLRFIYHT
jgi:hypothetical protein